MSDRLHAPLFGFQCSKNDYAALQCIRYLWPKHLLRVARSGVRRVFLSDGCRNALRSNRWGRCEPVRRQCRRSVSGHRQQFCVCLEASLLRAAARWHAAYFWWRHADHRSGQLHDGPRCTRHVVGQLRVELVLRVPHAFDSEWSKFRAKDAHPRQGL